MKLAHSQRKTLKDMGLRKPLREEGFEKSVCVRVQRGWLKEKRGKNAHETKRRDEVTKRMVSGEAITSSKEESLISKETERLY